MPTYKDINLLTQKAAMSGTEKIPVSDTEFITPDQITDFVTNEGQNYVPRCTINSSGGIDGNPDWFIGKDYIPVENGDTIVWNPGTNNWGGYLCLYDSSKQYLTNYSANAAERTVTLNNASVAYIRAPFYMDNLANAKIVRNGVTVWTPSDKANGVEKDLQNLSDDVYKLLGEKNMPFVIQNGTPGSYLNTNNVLIRGDKTVVIPVTPGHKYKIICNKTPVSENTFYFRIATYTTVSPAKFNMNTVRIWTNDWNNYLTSGGVFTINQNELGLSVMVTEATSPADSGVTPIRESDFVDGDIMIVDVTNSRFEKEIGDIETILASI